MPTAPTRPPAPARPRAPPARRARASATAARKPTRVPRAPAAGPAPPLQPFAPEEEAPPPAADAPEEASGGDPARAWVRWVPWLALAPLLSTVLGLGRVALAERGLGFFAEVWGASILADVLFVAGSAGLTYATAQIAMGRRGATGVRFVAAAAAGFALHALLYHSCWVLAQGLGAGGFSLGTLGDVVLAGFVGLVAMALYGPILGLFLPRPRPSP